MNNKLEVIGIDHGWSMMKTISQYEGKFYKVGTVRQEVKDTKVEDDSFYLLTLAAVLLQRKKIMKGLNISGQQILRTLRQRL